MSDVFLGAVSLMAAAGFVLYGGRLFLMLQASARLLQVWQCSSMIILYLPRTSFSRALGWRSWGCRGVQGGRCKGGTGWQVVTCKGRVGRCSRVQVAGCIGWGDLWLGTECCGCRAYLPASKLVISISC